MQIRHHLSAEQVHQLDVTLGRDWQEGCSIKGPLTDELNFEPKRDRVYAQESVGKNPKKRVTALPKQSRDK